MPWDANIATNQFKYKLPLQSFNQLQAAIKERCQGAGVAVPSIFNADMVKLTDMLPNNWFTTFQKTMTTLIAAYVNHTDNSGNWNGQTSIPNWTEATILAAIGDLSRIPVPSSKSHRICAKWCYQQYEILNMLRWIQKTNHLISQDRSYRSSNDWTADRWNEFLITAEAASSWGGDTLGNIFIRRNVRIESQFRAEYHRIKLIPPPTPFTVKIDVYCKGYNYFGDTWEDITGYTQTITLDLKKSIASAPPSYEEYYFEDDIYFTGNNPDGAPPAWGWKIYCNYQTMIPVFKFDGLNGFTYKDW